MSLIKFLDQFNDEELDSEAKDKFLSRKDALSKMTDFSKKLALSALPLGAISAMSSPAKAQSTDELIGVLNYALTLEHLENEFYAMGNAQSGLIPSGKDADIFMQIGKHEQQHVDFLIDTIDTLGGTPIEKPNFDFTVGGAFDPFNVYGQFLALSQAFEDTGVRAYKGQAPAVQGVPQVLTAALAIHSVEARHASEVRRLRGLKGWITQDERGEGMPEATQAVYNGEDQTSQLGVEVTSVTDVDADGVTEAWDEFLTMDDVNNIASLFITS